MHVRKGTRIAASGLVFLEGEVGYWAQLIFSDSRVPPGGSFTYCSDGRNRGNAGNLFKLPLQRALCTVCAEKSDDIHSNHSTPTASVVICFSFEGPGQNALKKARFASHTQWSKCHDLEFGIIVPPSNPMSWEVVFLVEKKTTAKAYHVNYYKAEHAASKPNHIIYVSG